ncbi:hypothetical protein [Xanthomonas phage XacN1]|nr:hypothetical protein [Xanthomonas phage XacN1]
MNLPTPEEAAVLRRLFTRYQEIAFEQPDETNPQPKCDWQSIIDLCSEAIRFGHTYPSDKMHRWLGFVQGVLAARGAISVDEERNYTRPIFHELYGEKVKTFDSSK